MGSRIVPIFLFSIIIRSYMIFFKGLNIDEYTTLGFIDYPDLTSVLWDNQPPLFYLLGKLGHLLPLDIETYVKLLVLLLNSISVLLYFHLFKRKHWIFSLIVATSPVLLANATLIRPQALIELLAILFLISFNNFFVLKRKSLADKVKLIVSALLLGTATYSAFFMLAVVFIYFVLDGRIKLNWKLFVGIALMCVLAVMLLYGIRWRSLDWISSGGSLQTQVESSFVWVRTILGYSWISMFVWITYLFIGRNWFSLIILAGIFVVNPLLAMAAVEPRFVFILLPILLYLLACDERIEARDKRLRLLILPIVFMNIWLSAWFIKSQKSQIDAAISWIQTQKTSEIEFLFSKSAANFIINHRSLSPVGDQNSCENVKVTVSSLHNPHFFDIDQKMTIPNGEFELIEGKEFADSKLESIKVWTTRRYCK